MVFKNLSVLVIWAKVALALEGLRIKKKTGASLLKATTEQPHNTNIHKL